MTTSTQDEKNQDVRSLMDLTSNITPRQLAFDFDDYDGPDELWLLYLWEKTLSSPSTVSTISPKHSSFLNKDL